MKKNKGFTLVELLAVIAILAILVIIALPNVMGMFNQAKKNSFMTECKQIYKVGQQQWINDSMFNTTEREYGRCDGCSYTELPLSGREEIKYYIKFNKAGDVVEFRVDDGTYQYEYDGDSLLITDITEADINESTDGVNTLTQNNVYVSTTANINIGSQIPSGVTTYDNYQDALNHSESGMEYFIKFKLVDDVVTEAHIGFIYNSNLYYIQGGDGGSSYQKNLNTLKQAFGASNCNIEEHSTSCSSYINERSIIGWIRDDGMVVMAYEGYFCGSNEYGGTSCGFVD